MQVTKKVTSVGSLIYRTMDKRCVARTCTQCKEFKPASQFSFSLSNRDLSGTCKTCENERLEGLRKTAAPRSPSTHNKTVKSYRQRNAARSARTVAQIQVDRYPDGKKPCSKCKQSKKLTEYRTFRGNPDGLQYQCKQCMAEVQQHSETKRK